MQESNPYEAPNDATHGAGKMNWLPKTLYLLAVAASAGAAVVAQKSLPIAADRLNLTWGEEFYLVTPLPYVVLAVLAVVFRKTTAGAIISLSGALILGGFGIYAMYTEGAMGISMLPIVLLEGCGVVLLAQLVRWGVVRRAHRKA